MEKDEVADKTPFIRTIVKPSLTNESHVNVTLCFDDMPPGPGLADNIKQVIGQYVADKMKLDSTSALAWGKMCDFCEQQLPLSHETQICTLCLKTFDSCSNCSPKKICHRTDCLALFSNSEHSFYPSFKQCDFCNQDLAEFYQTQNCSLCSKAFDSCLDCRSCKDFDTLCHRH